MAIEHDIMAKLRGLPCEKQLEVLDFVEFLGRTRAVSRPHRNLKGLWADFGVETTEEEIAEARRDMWGDFPRTAV